MNSNIINVILIKKCYQKGTLMKEAINISSDMKNLLMLGNSVSWVILASLTGELDSEDIQKRILSQKK